jgi:hypothetical protein
VQNAQHMAIATGETSFEMGKDGPVGGGATKGSPGIAMVGAFAAALGAAFLVRRRFDEVR